MASACVGAQTAVVVTMTLSLTKSPTGSAFTTAVLYCSSTHSMSETFWMLKPRTPSPLRAAMAYEGGDPAAYHIAGCDFPYGLGRILRGGSCQCLPWKPAYSSWSHILGNSAIVSSQISFVKFMSVMPGR